MFAFITWMADPTAFVIPFFGREVRWYGIGFALGFALGARMLHKIWEHEKLDPDWFDKLFFYVIIATIVGARLGHCLFYAPDYYLMHPIEIFKIWEGGLASHGGTLGIIVATWIYSKKISHKSMLWIFDRLVVPVGFVAALIRLGNLMNHEIYGYSTNVPWAFCFIENLPYVRMGANPIFSLPSHPTQLYEAFFYTITGFVCLWMYWKREDYKYPGLIFGVFLIGIFLSRFFIEYFKNIQEEFEKNWILDMGQILSIPFVLSGIWFAYNGLQMRLKIRKHDEC